MKAKNVRNQIFYDKLIANKTSKKSNFKEKIIKRVKRSKRYKKNRRRKRIYKIKKKQIEKLKKIQISESFFTIYYNSEITIWING